jgi:hypothetical protein
MTTSEDAPKNTKMIIIIIAILAVILLVVFFVNKNKSGGDGNNKVLTTIVVLAVVLFSVGFVNVNLDADTSIELAINGGGGDGGGGDSGVPPPGLTATINLNQLVYDVNTPVGITTNLTYAACANVTRNIVATGYISGNGYTGTTTTLFTSIMSGGNVSERFSTLIAPPTVGDGNYFLNVKIEGYELLEYRMTDGALSVVSGDFINFKTNVSNYIQDNYSSHPQLSQILQALASANNISDLQEGSITTLIPTMSFSQTGLTPVFVRNYNDILVKVVGVTAYINEKRPSDSVSYDGSAEIEWTAINPVYGCRCTFSPANGIGQTSCGQSGQNVKEYGPYNVSNLKTNTEFTIFCPVSL